MLMTAATRHRSRGHVSHTKRRCAHGWPHLKATKDHYTMSLAGAIPFAYSVASFVVCFVGKTAGVRHGLSANGMERYISASLCDGDAWRDVAFLHDCSF